MNEWQLQLISCHGNLVDHGEFETLDQALNTAKAIRESDVGRPTRAPTGDLYGVAGHRIFKTREASDRDGTKFALDRRPIKGTTQSRPVVDIDVQADWAAANARRRNSEGVETRLVPVHVWPAKSNRGHSHEFRLALAHRLAGGPATTVRSWDRQYLESQLEAAGYEFIEVDPDDWDPKVSAEVTS